MSEETKPIPNHGEDGVSPDLRMSAQGITATRERVTDEHMRWMFDNACQLLDQVTRIVSGVLDTVSIGDIRSVCADEFPVVRGAITPDGERASREVAEAKRDHRKEPRGRVHPLLVLIKLGVQAARLLKQIGSGTHPHAANAMTLAERMEAEAQRAYVELEKADKKFSAALAGG